MREISVLEGSEVEFREFLNEIENRNLSCRFDAMFCPNAPKDGVFQVRNFEDLLEENDNA